MLVSLLCLLVLCLGFVSMPTKTNSLRRITPVFVLPRAITGREYTTGFL